MSSLRLPATLLLVSSVSAFFHPTSWISRTARTGGVGSPSPAVPRGRTHEASTSTWVRQHAKQQHRRSGISESNVNLVVVPAGAAAASSRRLGCSGSSGSGFGSGSRGKRDRGSGSTLGMMAGTGYSERQDEVGGSAVNEYVPEYGMPSELGIELVRLDMPEVPVGLGAVVVYTAVVAAALGA